MTNRLSVHVHVTDRAAAMARATDQAAKASGVPVRNLPPLSIRLRPQLRLALEQKAIGNNVSLHAEILRRLQASVDQERGA